MSGADLDLMVDSTRVAAAAVDLDRLAAAAVEAGSSVDRLATTSRTTAAATETMVTATQQASSIARTAAASVHMLAEAEQMAAAASRSAAAAAAGHTEQLHGLRFAVGNVSAQFQDIAVTSMMGMNPWTIALQQGTQLASVLGMQGGGLTHIVRTLGAALGTVFSPLSLVTIGLVAASSAAIQWGVSIANSNKSSADALEDHLEWLEKILEGYDDVAEAAKDAVEEAMKLPQESVESDLAVKLAENMKTLQKETEKVLWTIADIDETFKYAEAFGVPDDVIVQLEALSEILRRVGADNKVTAEEADELHSAFTKFRNDTTDKNLDAIADGALEVLKNFRAATAAIDGTATALNNLSGISIPEWMRGHGGLLSVADSLEEIEDLTPDLRTAGEKVVDAFNRGIADARTTSEIDVLTDAYNKATDAIAKEEAEREAKRLSRRESPEEKWGESLADYRDRLEMMKLENELYDAGTLEREHRLQSQELLNTAMQDGMEDTPALREQISGLADEYARLALEAEGLQITLDNMTVWEKLGDELDNLDEKLRAGVITWETYTRAAGGAVADAASQTLGALASLSAGLSAAFEENKALSVATAVLKGAESIASAYATGNTIGGPPVGAVFAAIAAVTAAANVAAVLAVDKNSTSISTSASSSPSVPTASEGTGLYVQLLGSRSTPTTMGNVEDMLREIQDYLGTQGRTLAIGYKGD